MNFPSKLLLFGEYTVLQGSSALAVPFPAFGASWERSAELSPEERQVASLQSFCEYLELQCDSLIDSRRFHKEIEEGLFLRSDVPLGYGLGSSGTLVAAVAHRFGKAGAFPSDDNGLLLKHLAGMEGHFHGSSSGIDPLVAYLGQPLTMKNGLPPQSVTVPAYEYGSGAIFLVDTQSPRNTAALVTQYHQRRAAEDSFEKITSGPLAELHNAAIQYMLLREVEQLLNSVAEISVLQMQHMEDWIPFPQRSSWAAGLESGIFSLKLCGAGGGGFLLGFTENWALTQELLPTEKLMEVCRL